VVGRPDLTDPGRVARRPAMVTVAAAGAHVGAWDGGRALYSPLLATSLHGLGGCAASLVAAAARGRGFAASRRVRLWLGHRRAGGSCAAARPAPAQIMVLAKPFGIGIGQPGTNRGFD
jgi:hypothetical protein